MKTSVSGNYDEMRCTHGFLQNTSDVGTGVTLVDP